MREFVAVDKDRIINAGTKEVSQGIVALADVAQKLPKHVRLLAAAGFLTLLLERFHIPKQDVMSILGNLRTEADRSGRVEFKAIEEYLRTDF